MAYCQRAHDLRQCPVNVGSPQTDSQREQVTRVVTALIQHRKSQATAAALGPPPKITYPPVASATSKGDNSVALENNCDRITLKKQPSLKGISDLQKATDGLMIDTSNPMATGRNNIAVRTSGEPIQLSRGMSVVASPPVTPPASASGKRGGRNVQYTMCNVDSGTTSRARRRKASLAIRPLRFWV